MAKAKIQFTEEEQRQLQEMFEMLEGAIGQVESHQEFTEAMMELDDIKKVLGIEL